MLQLLVAIRLVHFIGVLDNPGGLGGKQQPHQPVLKLVII
jgi:hypothetical protein